MFKEICIIVIIITSIIIGQFFTQDYLKSTSNMLIDKLDEMYECIKDKENPDYNKLENVFKELEEMWINIEKKWSLIVVHSELDMIEVAVSNVKTGIENENLTDVTLKIKELQFLFMHIVERDAFKLKNIF